MVFTHLHLALGLRVGEAKLIFDAFVVWTGEIYVS